MRDAIGGSVVITIITVFIVIALSYMAFNVNYTKAFRMKDKIIALYEETEGKCHTDSDCQREIVDYAKSIGYAMDPRMSCPSGYTMFPDGGLIGQGKYYCVKEVHSYKKSSYVGKEAYKNDRDDLYYYQIVTKINIDIPIIKNIFNFNVFLIKGDTRQLRRTNGS